MIRPFLLTFLALAACVPTKKYDAQLDRAANLSLDLASRSAEVASAQGRIAFLEAELVAANARYKELDALSVALSQRNEEMQKQLADFQTQLSSLTAKDKAQKEQLEAALKAVQASAQAAETQAEEARARMAEMDKERQRLAEEAERLKAEKDQLEAKTADYDNLVRSLESEIKAGQVTITELSGRLTVNLSNAILFESGSYALKPEGSAALGKVAEVLKTVHDRGIRVEGYTDNVPVNPGAAFADNWALSSLRASTVVALLVKAGVDPGNIAAVGYGENHPVKPNDTPEGKAANRRTEIVLVPRL